MRSHRSFTHKKPFEENSEKEFKEFKHRYTRFRRSRRFRRHGKKSILQELKKLTSGQEEIKENQKKILERATKSESRGGWPERSSDSNQQENGGHGKTCQPNAV